MLCFSVVSWWLSEAVQLVPIVLVALVVLVPVAIVMIIVVATWSVVVVHCVTAMTVLVIMRSSVMMRSDAAGCGQRKCAERD